MDGPVFGEDLKELVEEILVVVVHHELELTLVLKGASGHLARDGAFGVLAEVSIQSVGVLYMIEVGRREIYTQLETVLLAGGGEIFEYVSFAALEVGGHYAVFGIATLPKDKAIVVFGRQDDHLHAGCLHGLAPLVGVQVFQVKYLGVLLAVAPFHACEGVGAEVYEGYELVFDGLPLVGRRYHMYSLVDDTLTGVIGSDFDGVGIAHLAALCMHVCRAKQAYDRQ